MGEPGKLAVGFLGVVLGLAAGLGIFIFIMQRTGGSLVATPTLGLLVVVLVGGGAAAVGYGALAVVERIEKSRKRASRKEKKRGKK